MAILFARNRIFCTIWFAVSIIYTIYMIINNFSFGDRYASIIGASLPFSAGSMMYYYFRRNIQIKNAIKHIKIASAILISYILLSSIIWKTPTDFGFYISLMIGFYLQLSLANLNNSPSRLTSIDKKLGN